ncbi:myosin V [Nematocida sp. AWRm77]|nr:myosin V [Nematocida sp. AWRm77]
MKKHGELLNLSLLEKYSEETILETLQSRHVQGCIYTFAGPALVSINPQKELGIYGTKEKEEAQTNIEYPHVFTIAERAFQGMVRQENQVVIMSGESGSGKTVNANYILEYLAEKASGSGGAEKKLKWTASILEMFGNASTLCNENSSRFGKYVELYYQRGQITGATIKGFLLEKGRSLSPKENFHAVMLVQELMNSCSGPAAHKLCALLKHFNRLEMEEDKVLGIFRVLSAIVYLVSAKVEEGKEGEGVIRDAQPLQKAGALLSISSEDLDELITKKKTAVGKEVFVRSKTRAECLTSKETLVRAMYESLFQYLVRAINSALRTHTNASPLAAYLAETDSAAKEKSAAKFLARVLDVSYALRSESPPASPLQEPSEGCKIGVLDIYGFEIMKSNGLDQLCINYANEKIQAEYVRRVIVENRKAFEEEGIELERLSMLSQAESVFEGSLGLVKLLDEESFLPGGSTQSLLQKISSLGAIRTRGSSMEIHHYAGKVEYEAEEFVQRNRNVYSSTFDVLNKSSLSMLHGSVSYAGQMSKTGVIGEFQKSLHSLLQEINQSTLHYVRCIKPCLQTGFDRDYVAQQLKFTGVFETVKIFMLGFFAKMSKQEFLFRYGANAQETVAQVGKTYVFLTEEEHARLEAEKKAKEERAAQQIQTHLRKHVITAQKLREHALKAQKLQKEKEREKLLLQQAPSVPSVPSVPSMDKDLSSSSLQYICSYNEASCMQLPKTSPSSTNQKDLCANSTSLAHSYEKDVEDKKESAQETHLPNIFERYSPPHALSLSPASDAETDSSSVDSNSYTRPGLFSAPSSTCAHCASVDEKYQFQIVRLQEQQKTIEALTAQIDKARHAEKEKDQLIKDLSHKMEVLLYELSSGEYFKTTASFPISATENVAVKVSASEKTSPEIFKKLCKIFIHSIPSSYSSYHKSVCCAFALFRVAAICKGDLSANISTAIRAFESSAHTILVVKKTAVPVYVAFFLSNAIFIARTSPGQDTSDMLQSIFFEGCRVIAEEILSFGLDFLFRSSSFEPSNILSKLLKKPSIDSVAAHLRMVYTTLVGHYIPHSVILSLFDYVAKVIDTSGFEHLIKKEKQFGLRQLLHLDRSLDTLSGLLLDFGVSHPFSLFTYLKGYVQFASTQRKGVIPQTNCLQLGIFTSSQMLAVITSFSHEIKGEHIRKLEQALKDVGMPEKLSQPIPVFPTSLEEAEENPTLLYKALHASPECKNIQELLLEHNISFESTE